MHDMTPYFWFWIVCSRASAMFWISDSPALVFSAGERTPPVKWVSAPQSAGQFCWWQEQDEYSPAKLVVKQLVSKAEKNEMLLQDDVV